MDVLKCKLTQKRGKVLITWERLLVNITLSPDSWLNIFYSEACEGGRNDDHDDDDDDVCLDQNDT